MGFSIKIDTVKSASSIVYTEMSHDIFFFQKKIVYFFLIRVIKSLQTVRTLINVALFSTSSVSSKYGPYALL